MILLVWAVQGFSCYKLVAYGLHSRICFRIIFVVLLAPTAIAEKDGNRKINFWRIRGHRCRGEKREVLARSCLLNRDKDGAWTIHQSSGISWPFSGWFQSRFLAPTLKSADFCTYSWVRVMNFSSSHRAQIAKKIISAKSGVSADSRKNSQKFTKPHWLRKKSVQKVLRCGLCGSNWTSQGQGRKCLSTMRSERNTDRLNLS